MTPLDRAAETFAWLRTANAAGQIPARIGPALIALESGLARRPRVAVIGRVSAGKSTLINAVTGRDVAAVGAHELTFTVAVLRSGPGDEVVVHFSDRRPEAWPWADLRRLSVRNERERRLLAAIDHLDIRVVTPFLNDFDLVDTPGLDSAYLEDSARTLRLLGRSAADIDRASTEHAIGADGVVLVLNRAGSAEEFRLLEQVSGQAPGLPVTALAVRTKIELLWPACADPMAEGQRIATQVLRRPEAEQLLQDVIPVASLVAAGAGTLTEDDLNDLSALASRVALNPDEFDMILARGPGFATDDRIGLPVPAARRADLMRRLGQYGIHLATRLLAAPPNPDLAPGADQPVPPPTDLAGLQAGLRALSGVDVIRDRLHAYFATRAGLVRLPAVVERARYLIAAARPGADPVTQAGLDTIEARFRSLLLEEPGFEEISLLRRVRRDQLDLDPADRQRLLRMAGEHGGEPSHRLGLLPGASPQQCLAAARAALTDLGRPGQAPPNHRVERSYQRRYERMIADLCPDPDTRPRHVELIPEGEDR